MHKDMTYALNAADVYGVPMPSLTVAREIYRMARNLGYDDADAAAVIEVLRRVP
jgi:3-hydroxyisobutyrate dehydrogenase-like beta-hydroxyacid dehydrogenase